MTREETLIRLMNEHQRDLWRYLRYIGVEAALADDLTQEVFIELYHNPIIEISRDATSAWLRKAAKHRYLNALRKLKREVPVEWLDEADGAWESLTSDSSDDRLDALQRCLQKLNERARQAIELKYTRSRKETDVAEALQTTAEAAKALLKRAREQLRDCVQRQVQS